jgi:integrase
MEKGCKTSPRCNHWYHLKVKDGNVLERGPVTQFWKLLRPDPKTGLVALPRTEKDAIRLEDALRVWVKDGRPELRPTFAPPEGADVKASMDVKPSPVDVTINAAAVAYRKDHITDSKDNSAKTTFDRIVKDYGEMNISQLLDRRSLRGFVAELEDEDASDGTINRYTARWSHFLNWCRAEYKLTGESPFYHKHNSPMGLKKRKEEPRKRRLRTDPIDEEQALIAAAKELGDGQMMLGRLYCAIDCGPRRGEMLQLRDEDVKVNYEGHQGYTLHFRASTTKSGIERYVAVTSERLTDWLAGRKRLRAAFVFGNADGSRVDSFRVDWENLQIAAGLLKGHYETRKAGEHYGAWVTDVDADLRWHDLRHECGTRLMQNGASPATVMETLGHTRLETTQLYVNPGFKSNAAQLAAAHKKLGV